MSKSPAGATAKSGTTTAAPAPTGCCTIAFDDGTGQQFEHITEEECRQKALALGGAAAWVPGNCA
jgi:hypothetical protein